VEAERKGAVKMKAIRGRKAEGLLIKAYRKNLVNTIDFIEYAKRLNGFYCLDIVKKLERLLGRKGQTSILAMVSIVYLVLIGIVLICMF